jgi:hypothetical protein
MMIKKIAIKFLKLNGYQQLGIEITDAYDDYMHDDYAHVLMNCTRKTIRLVSRMEMRS